MNFESALVKLRKGAEIYRIKNGHDTVFKLENGVLVSITNNKIQPVSQVSTESVLATDWHDKKDVEPPLSLTNILENLTRLSGKSSFFLNVDGSGMIETDGKIYDFKNLGHIAEILHLAIQENQKPTEIV